MVRYIEYDIRCLSLRLSLSSSEKSGLSVSYRDEVLKVRKFMLWSSLYGCLSFLAEVAEIAQELNNRSGSGPHQ